MDEELESTEVETDTAVEPAAEVDETPAEKTFTQAEVDDLIRKRLSRTRAKTKARAKPKAQERTQVNEAAGDGGEWRDSFYDAVMGVDLTKGQLKRMRTAFKAATPDDPDSWVSDYLTDFGIGSKTAESETDNKEGDTAEASTVKPTSDRGAPTTTPDYDTEIDPNRLNADDIRRMEQKYGKRQAHRKLRVMVENHYRGRPLVIPQ